MAKNSCKEYINQYKKDLEGKDSFTLDFNLLSKLQIKAFAAIVNQHHIKTLNVINRPISDKGLKTLVKALQDNNTITTLDLSNNNLGYNEAEMLSEMLKTNNNIQELNLSYNCLSDREVMILANKITHNSKKSLSTLDLSNNYITDMSVVALTIIAKYTPHLTELKLANNQLLEESVTSINKALQEKLPLQLSNPESHFEPKIDEKDEIPSDFEEEILYDNTHLFTNTCHDIWESDGDTYIAGSSDDVKAD